MKLFFERLRLGPVLGIFTVLAVSACGGSNSPSGPVVDAAPVVIADGANQDVPNQDGTEPEDTAGSSETVGDADIPAASDALDVVADIVTVDVTNGTYVPSDFPRIVTSADVADQIIFTDSGIMLIRRSALTSALNEPGAIRNLLADVVGRDFPQAANWTFRVLDNRDTISELLRIRFGFVLPWWWQYENVVVGDEQDFIDTFLVRYFPGLNPDTSTSSVTSDILTSSVTSVAVSSSTSSY